MSKHKALKPLSIAIGAALGTALVAGPVQAGDSTPFSMSTLSSGYMLSPDGGEGKCGEGKCGEGKCGEGKAEKEGKCGEGKCGEGKAKKEGKCG